MGYVFKSRREHVYVISVLEYLKLIFLALYHVYIKYRRFQVEFCSSSGRISKGKYQSKVASRSSPSQVGK